MKLYSDGDNLIFADYFNDDKILYVFEDFYIKDVSMTQHQNLIDVTSFGNPYKKTYMKTMPSFEVDLSIYGNRMEIDPDKEPIEILFKNTPIIDLIKLINMKVKGRD